MNNLNNSDAANLFSLAPMSPTDIDEIAQIENAAFSVPWSEDAFEYFLGSDSVRSYSVRCESDIPCYDGETNGFVNIPRGTVAGYAVLSYVLGSVSDDGSVIELGGGEVINIAVRRELRRRGIAHMLLDRIISDARELALSVLMLEVRRSNAPARALYESYGFRSVGVRRNYYKKPREDAILMNLDLEVL